MIKGGSCFSLIYLKGEFGISLDFHLKKVKESTIAQENTDFFINRDSLKFCITT